MRTRTFAAILSGWLLGVSTLARADGPERLLVSAQALSGRAADAASAAGDGRSRALRLTNSGSAAESIVCLTFDRRESQRTFGLRGAHVYACFNFLRDPAEAVGAVLDRRGRAQCLVTGSFRQGATAAEDCLILALCGDVFVTGAC
jgi:hypothetical protein